MDVVEVTVTGPRDWMPGYLQQLLAERLIACAQVTDVQSTYIWEGRVDTAAEARAHLHTLHDHVPALLERTRDLHPYDTPCVLALPTVGCDAGYAAWVEHTTRRPT